MPTPRTAGVGHADDGAVRPLPGCGLLAAWRRRRRRRKARRAGAPALLAEKPRPAGPPAIGVVADTRPAAAAPVVPAPPAVASPQPAPALRPPPPAPVLLPPPPPPSPPSVRPPPARPSTAVASSTEALIWGGLTTPKPNALTPRASALPAVGVAVAAAVAPPTSTACGPAALPVPPHASLVALGPSAGLLACVHPGPAVPYAWGEGSSGALARGWPVPPALTPTPVRAWPRSAGRPASLAVSGTGGCVAVGSADGSVWVWGSGTVARTGGGPLATHVPRRLRFWSPPSTPAIVAVAAGHAHAAALDSAGRVWTWGDAQGGRLGHGGRAVAATSPPRLVAGPLGEGAAWRATGLACGAWHTLAAAVTVRGGSAGPEVWAWGALPPPPRPTAGGAAAPPPPALARALSGRKQRPGPGGGGGGGGAAGACLGVGDGAGRPTPTRAGLLGGSVGVAALAAGDGFSLALGRDGRAWQAGRTGGGGGGGGGAGPPPRPAWEGAAVFTPVPLSATVVSIAAGDRHAVVAAVSPGGAGRPGLWTWSGAGGPAPLRGGEAGEAGGGGQAPPPPLGGRRLVGLAAGGTASLALVDVEPAPLVRAKSASESGGGTNGGASHGRPRRRSSSFVV